MKLLPLLLQKEERRIFYYETDYFLDNAATTKTRPEVVDAMLPYFTEFYGNPSSVYDFSAEPKKAIAHARETIAGALGAKPNEIYFTNGGTESDNWALIATAEAYQNKGNHIITTKIGIMPSSTPVNTWRIAAFP